MIRHCASEEQTRDVSNENKTTRDDDDEKDEKDEKDDVIKTAERPVLPGMLFSISVRYTSRLSKSVHCLVTSFTMNGFLSFTYSCAFSSGKSLLKKLTSASTTGHDSIGSFRMTSSANTSISNS